MEVKLLEEQDVIQMQEVLEDDNMVFNVDNLKNFINTKNAYGFIAKDNDRVVGFAYGYGLTRPDGKVMFYLHSIGVLPNIQNKGVGSKMMKFIVDFAKGNNFSEVFVITEKGNTRACHVYEKSGFKNDIENEIVYVCEF